MSHFTVMVIGEDWERQLLPYKEAGCGAEDPPELQSLLVFEDEEEARRREYETETITKVVMEDGRMLNPWDDEFRVKGSIGIGSDTHKVPDDLEQREVPYKELYTSFEKYMKDWCGEERDEKTGKYGRWYNPNQKWDWYMMGGRWVGFFKMKNGTGGVPGDPSFMVDPPRAGFADQARKGEIDFEGMRAKAAKEAGEKFDKVQRACDGQIPKLDFFWEDLNNPRFQHLSIQEKREAYRHQDGMVKWTSFRKKADGNDMFCFLDLEEFQETKEEYVERARLDAIATFAVVKDGKWYERGDMGWWGIVSDEKDRDTWRREFNALIDGVSDDTLLTVVDCHI